MRTKIYFTIILIMLSSLLLGAIPTTNHRWITGETITAVSMNANMDAMLNALINGNADLTIRSTTTVKSDALSPGLAVTINYAGHKILKVKQVVGSANVLGVMNRGSSSGTDLPAYTAMSFYNNAGYPNYVVTLNVLDLQVPTGVTINSIYMYGIPSAGGEIGLCQTNLLTGATTVIVTSDMPAVGDHPKTMQVEIKTTSSNYYWIYGTHSGASSTGEYLREIRVKYTTPSREQIVR